jgi:peptidylprolyl isomerase
LSLKTDDEVKEWLAAQGLSIDCMRKQKEKQLIAEEYLRQMVMPFVDRIGHEQIVEYYRGHPEEFQVAESIKWQDLLIDVSRYSSREEARQVAQQVARRIQMKEDFLKLAELYNPQAFQFTRGDGYGQKRGEIQPREAEPVLFALRDGDVTLVEMPTGFHVVRMVNHTYAGRMPLDDKVQTQIRDKLRNEVGIREQKRFLAHLKANATIAYSSLVPGQTAESPKREPGPNR